MRLLICGGRDYHNYDFISKTLREFHKDLGITVLIHGNADGADKLAAAWAWDNQIDTWAFPVPFDESGIEARNKQILDEYKPDHVIAFPGHEGTANMIQQAEERGVTVTEY